MTSAEKDHFERELKFACPNLEALRERLPELSAERVGASALEDNLVLDRDAELQARGCLLRLRLDRQGARLTFKGPVRFEDQTKIRMERETAVEDAKELLQILGDLGFQQVRRYQKIREDWRLGAVTVSLDHTPIGGFAEFEGEGAERVAKRCGFDVATAIVESYLELYEAHRAANPEASAEMIFP